MIICRIMVFDTYRAQLRIVVPSFHFLQKLPLTPINLRSTDCTMISLNHLLTRYLTSSNIVSSHLLHSLFIIHYYSILYACACYAHAARCTPRYISARHFPYSFLAPSPFSWHNKIFGDDGQYQWFRMGKCTVHCRHCSALYSLDPVQ